MGGTALPYWLEFRLELAYAWITHSQDQVSPELKEKMKRIIVGDEWDRNAYYFLSQSMILMDFDDAASLVNSAYKAYDKNPKTDIFTLQWISFVGVNFLNYCYHHHAGEKYTESSIKFLKSLPITPDLGFSKVLALYYEALFNGDRKTQQSLIHLLKEIGYYSLIQDTVKEDV